MLLVLGTAAVAVYTDRYRFTAAGNSLGLDNPEGVAQARGADPLALVPSASDGGDGAAAGHFYVPRGQAKGLRGAASGRAKKIGAPSLLLNPHARPKAVPKVAEPPATPPRFTPDPTPAPTLGAQQAAPAEPDPAAAAHGTRRSPEEITAIKGNKNRQTHFVFSTSCTMYQQWQSELLFWSHMHSKAGSPEGTVVRLVSGCGAKALEYGEMKHTVPGAQDVLHNHSLLHQSTNPQA